MMDDRKREDSGGSGGMNLIDMAVRQSSAELKRLVQYYKQTGRNEEARKIDEALGRLERRDAQTRENTGERLDH